MAKTQQTFKKKVIWEEFQVMKLEDAYPPIKPVGQYCKQWQGYLHEFIAEDIPFS